MFLGVDGGGTNCRMRLAGADLNTIAEAKTSRASNLQVRNGDAAHEAITHLTGEICARAGLSNADLAQIPACFGMAGGRMASARATFAAREFPFAGVDVYDDIDIARAGAHQGADGAVLIIGTGSAGLALIEGKRHQIGGWGFHVGDTMAGAILGRELLRKSLLAHEGLEPATPLTEAVMARFDNNQDTLMSWSFKNPEIGRPARPADYGQFVPMFFDYHDKGDAVAIELMDFELKAVDQYVHWFMAKGARAIAIVGGFGRRLHPLLAERYGDIIVEAKSDALHGALILARQAARTV